MDDHHEPRTIREEIERVGQDLVVGLQKILSHSLHAAYLYGAAVFPDTGPLGDIDFHVLLTETPDLTQVQAVRELHADLARSLDPGTELDGWYILLQDALRPAPPPHLLVPGLCDQAWALHRAHWIARRCVVLYGPEAASYLPRPTWPELEWALESEMSYVKAHLLDAPAYGVLNLCRLVYSFSTHEVAVSKRGCAAWALERFPEWRPLMIAAVRAYDRRASESDRDRLSSQTPDFWAYASGLIHTTSASTEGWSCLLPGQVVRVSAFKADGTRYRTWQASVESTAADRLVLIAPAGHVVHALGGDWLSPWAIRAVYWPGRHFALLEVFSADGQIEELYANIASPVRIDGNDVWFTDHEIDVSLRPPGPARIVDEDEFAEAAARYGYSDDFQQECYRAAGEAVEIIRGWIPGAMPSFSPA